jgi:hypothetical protein
MIRLLSSSVALLLYLLSTFTVSAAETFILAVPAITFHLTVNDKNDDLVVSDFRSSLLAATSSHLSTELNILVNSGVEDVEEDGVFLENLKLDIARLGYENGNSNGDNVDARVSMRVDFEGKVTVAVVGENHLVTSDHLDELVIESFTGDSYWRLWHRFVADELLQHIYDVGIDVNSIPVEDAFTIIHDDDAPNEKLMKPLFVGLVAAMGAALLLTIVAAGVYLCRRNTHHDGGHHSKGSQCSTCEEHESDEEVGSQPSPTVPVQVTPQPKAAPRRERVRASPSILDSISEATEEEESSFSGGYLHRPGTKDDLEESTIGGASAD